jgi:hypothetical protein
VFRNVNRKEMWRNFVILSYVETTFMNSKFHFREYKETIS